MRYLLLILFILFNTIAIGVTMTQPLTVSYFSLRVMFVGLSFVLTIFFLLLRKSKVTTYLKDIISNTFNRSYDTYRP